MAVTVEAMAIDAVELGDPRRAAMLATGATRLRERWAAAHRRARRPAGPARPWPPNGWTRTTFSAAADEGSRLTMEELVALALAVPDRPT